jgi:hypothetical protein
LNNIRFFENGKIVASASKNGQYYNRFSISSDSGKIWSIFLNRNSNNAIFYNPDTGYTVISSKILRTINGGLSWDTIQEDLPDYIYDFEFYNTKTGFANVKNNGVYVTTDAGNTWRLLSDNYSYKQDYQKIKCLYNNSQFYIFLYSIDYSKQLSILKSMWDSAEIWRPVSIQNQNFKNTEIKIFPNPVNDILNINWSCNSKTSMHIRILDPLCKTIYQNKFDSKTTEVKINVSQWAEGMYITEFNFGNQIVQRKFIKK